MVRLGEDERSSLYQCCHHSWNHGISGKDARIYNIKNMQTVTSNLGVHPYGSWNPYFLWFFVWGGRWGEDGGSYIWGILGTLVLHVCLKHSWKGVMCNHWHAYDVVLLFQVVCVAFVLACLIRSNKNDTNVDIGAVVRNYRERLGCYQGNHAFTYLITNMKKYNSHFCPRCS